MPLMAPPPPSPEDFIPYIKYNAKAGRWYNKTDSGEVEIQNLTAIFDLAQIKTGWFLYADGMAPDRVYHNGTFVQRPSPKHKSGVLFNIYSPQQLGGLREFGSTASLVVEAIRDLYDNHFENAPEAKQGLVPVVKCLGVTPVRVVRDTNYQPMLQIVKWVPRPADLKLGPAAPPVQAASPSASPEVPPPVMTPPPQASADAEEF